MKDVGMLAENTLLIIGIMLFSTNSPLLGTVAGCLFLAKFALLIYKEWEEMIDKNV